jgi:hypothetical protein
MRTAMRINGEKEKGKRNKNNIMLDLRSTIRTNNEFLY